MKHRCLYKTGLLLVFVFLLESFAVRAETMAVQMIPTYVNMQSDAPGNLYALSAVLMDADSGRVLYEKEGDTPRANASTTKVLTCILALENASGDDYVMVSSNAAAQPEVKLGLRQGEQYYMEDLLYSLMLKSHNDSAVAIAEHIGGSVEGFAAMMNEKARKLGCEDTHFVTPNGLDASDEGGAHHTTARDLALIMRYAIKNKTFLHITQTRDYSFSDISGKRQFSVHNANALLDMMEGVLSGKTGFTGEAGYCYVCAWRKNEKTFIVSLLGCGWPNHKTYKWSDTKALLGYGDENFQYRPFFTQPSLKKVEVQDGVAKGTGYQEKIYVTGSLNISEEEKEKTLLLNKDERISCRVSMPDVLTAPVKKGQKIGTVTYSLEEKDIASFDVISTQYVPRISYSWCVEQVFHDFFH